ncbi:cAMP-specific phosphodiesterase, putative [Bodo saltans]|uniref:cAMP-specific phosphodiesterase, putative n=1 Tax=Bodo saltans TaxID=75058 RepID=A0A0S4J2W3_BODSA|nr:cAMP-specific phosphodiesterase, putative [Bodo saltans]|eukprot:CUG61985.1 cAMP-specific phosphodiesterase, putative [Bodo saltans]
MNITQQLVSPSRAQTRVITELDEVLSQSELSDSLRQRLASVRVELASPSFQQFIQQGHGFGFGRTPNSASLISHGHLPPAIVNEDLEASRWMASTYQSPRVGAATVPLPFVSEGIPTLDLSAGDVGKVVFSRSPCRHKLPFATAGERDDIFGQLRAAAFPETVLFLSLTGDASFNPLEAAATHGLQHRGLFFSVICTALSHYAFMKSLNVDIRRFIEFITSVADSYPLRTNPFHNLARSADVIQFLHSFLVQRQIAENFSDLELLATFIGTIGLDACHPGVSNEFYDKIRHTTVLLYGSVCPIEQASLCFVLELLEADGTNMLIDYELYMDNRTLQQQFITMVSEIILCSAPRSYGRLMQALGSIGHSGHIGDEDIVFIAAAAVRCADHAYVLKPRTEHIYWVTQMLTECMRQGCEEEKRLLPISPLCGSDSGEHASAAISAMINYVIAPLFERLTTLVPQWWIAQLQRIRTMYHTASATSGREDDDHATSPPILYEPLDSEEWVDVIHPVIASIRRLIGGGGGPPLLDRKASQHAILNATPHRQLSASANFGESFMGGTSRTEHYFSLVRLFDRFDRDQRSFSDFSGNVVFLAAQLDPAYVASYASSDLSSPLACTVAAQLIVDTEQSPSTAEGFASPSKKSQQTTDGFLLQLLHMYKRGEDRREQVNGFIAPKRRFQIDNPIYAPKPPSSPPQ